MVTFNEPGTILGGGDTAVNEVDKILALKKFILYRERQAETKGAN